MPSYVVIVQEKGLKKKTLPEIIFAPCASDAWEEAKKNIPKRTKIVDVMPEKEIKKY